MPPRAGSPAHSPMMTRLLAVLLLLVAGALVYTVIMQRRNRVRTVAAPAPAPATIVPRGDLAEDEKTTISLFKSVSPSVVHITSIDVKPSILSRNVMELQQGTGTGFVWDTQGHIVTNDHVIRNANKARVTLSDNTVFEAKIVGRAPHKDLAVLKIDPPQGLRAIAIGESRNLQVGQKVFAIGNPFGLDQTLTTGIISGLGREIQSVTRRPIEDVVQTDASINPGNSGGPLLDSAGRVIGVNTAIYSPSGASAGIGFAIPIDTVNHIVPQLISNKRVSRPGLGITIENDAMAQRNRISGVIVKEVRPGSAAAKAGFEGERSGPSRYLVLGDVIVGFEGKEIKNTQDLFRALNRYKVGDTVTVELSRDGNRRKVQVTLQDLSP